MALEQQDAYGVHCTSLHIGVVPCPCRMAQPLVCPERRIFALGFRGYFTNAWLVFDCAITLLSVMGLLVDSLSSQSLVFLPVLRALRIARIFRLIPRAKGLRKLVRTLYWWVQSREGCAPGKCWAMLCSPLQMVADLRARVFSHPAFCFVCSNPQVDTCCVQHRVRALPNHVPMGNCGHECICQHQAHWRWHHAQRKLQALPGLYDHGVQVHCVEMQQLCAVPHAALGAAGGVCDAPHGCSLVLPTRLRKQE